MLDNEECEDDNLRVDATVIHWGHTHNKEPISVTRGLLMPQASDCSIASHYSADFEAQYPTEMSEFNGLTIPATSIFSSFAFLKVSGIQSQTI